MESEIKELTKRIEMLENIVSKQSETIIQIDKIVNHISNLYDNTLKLLSKHQNNEKESTIVITLNNGNGSELPN